MRSILIVGIIVSVSQCLPNIKLNVTDGELAISRQNAKSGALRLFTTGQTTLLFKDAVEKCKEMKAFAPSLHSKLEIDFWVAALPHFHLFDDAFWLDAYCPTIGVKWVWMDGTPTDYVGPDGELDKCEERFAKLFLDYGISEAEFATSYAPALCAYALDPAPLTPPAGQGDCRDDFDFNQGLCIWTCEGCWVTYRKAMDDCRIHGAFAPSIHSEQDITSWMEYLANDTYGGNNRALFLGAYCPNEGEPYKWLDGTPTDYLGPGNKLARCSSNTVITIDTRIGIMISTNYDVGASSYCVYDPLAPTTAPKPRQNCGETPVTPDLTNHITKTVVPYSWPWQVVLCSKDWFSDNICNFGCGASIIAPGWIMTAASCVYDDVNPKNYKVKAGVFDEATSDQSAEQIATVKAIHVNPSYNARKMTNDIALIELTTSLILGDHVQPVCLSDTDSSALSYPGEVWVTGWGTTDTNTNSRKLHQADVPIVDLPACKNEYPGIVYGKVEFCAGKLSDTCQGDIGGPIVSEASSGHWYQFGVVA